MGFFVTKCFGTGQKFSIINRDSEFIWHHKNGNRNAAYLASCVLRLICRDFFNYTNTYNCI